MTGVLYEVFLGTAHMELVLKLIGAGGSFGLAVTDALGQAGLSAKSFCEKYADVHSTKRSTFSEMLNLRRVPSEGDLDALSAELGGTRAAWLDLWFKVAKHTPQRRTATVG